TGSVDTETVYISPSPGGPRDILMAHASTIDADTATEQFTITPPATTTTPSVGTHSVNYGKTLTIKAHVTLTGSGADAGDSGIKLQRRYSSADAWTNTATTYADLNGRAEVSVAPKRNTQYRWFFTGDYLGAGPSYSD